MGVYTPLTDEFKPFTVQGTQLVRYGMGEKWVAKEVTGEGMCSNEFFGVDPVPGVTKACQVLVPGALPAPAPSPAPVPPSPIITSGPTWQEPIVITRGGEYNGAWVSLDPRVPAVDIRTRELVIINGEIQGKGHQIRADWQWVNLVLGKLHAVGLNPNDRNLYMGRLLTAEGIESLKIDEVTGDGTAGIYVNEWRRGTEVPYTVQIGRVLYNNVEGRYSDGNGGFQDKFYRLQALQLNNLRNIPGVDVGWIKVINKPGQSRPEDVINLHDCSGTPDSWINLHDILINGAYGWPVDAVYSGGGIMLADTWGEYMRVVRSVVLETSNYGIAVATGNNIEVLDNLALGTGQLPDGTILDGDPDAGFYCRNYSPHRGARRPETVLFARNKSGWSRPRKDDPNARWDYSIELGMATERDNTYLPAGPVRQELLDQAVRDWEGRAVAAGMVPGVKKWAR